MDIIKFCRSPSTETIVVKSYPIVFLRCGTNMEAEFINRAMEYLDNHPLRLDTCWALEQSQPLLRLLVLELSNDHSALYFLYHFL